MPQRPRSHCGSIGGIGVSLTLADVQTSTAAALVCARGSTLRSELSCGEKEEESELLEGSNGLADLR